MHKGNKDERTCGFCVVRAVIEECECSDYTSYQLPCRHIYAVLQHFYLPLFDRTLCNPRIIRENNSLSILNNFANASLEDVSPAPEPLYTNMPKDSKPTFISSKQKLIREEVADMIEAGILTSNHYKFDKRLA